MNSTENQERHQSADPWWRLLQLRVLVWDSYTAESIYESIVPGVSLLAPSWSFQPGKYQLELNVDGTVEPAFADRFKVAAAEAP